MIPSDVSRKLTTIERALTADMPVLAARFELFNRLAAGDGPVTAEPVAEPAPVAAPAPVRPRPRPAHLAVLLILGAVIALCVTLSIRTSPVPHQCVASGAVGSVGTTSVRALTCPTFANR